MFSHIAKAIGFALLGLFITPTLFSQQNTTLYGIVTDDQNELLVGATVTWKDKKGGAITDAEGAFRLPKRNHSDTLVVQYVGFQPVAIEVLPHEDSIWIEIKGITELKTVTVTDQNFGNTVSMLDPRNVESISSKELRKAPCCNLSESFETNGAVDVTYADAVTGVKEIQMLGLRGIYSQFLVENRPTMSGIAAPFAFEYYPGTWLSGIVLAKGASTVKNGYAGITGQINADLVSPEHDKPLFVNLFTSTEGRAEANIHLNKKLNETTAHGLLLHASGVRNRRDMNDDNFYDMPNRSQLNALYRWKYDGPLGCGQFNVQALTDGRKSGQIDPIIGSTAFFDVNQRNDRVEAWAKYGKEGIGGKPFNQIGNIAGVSWHRTASDFGPNLYRAEQRSLYFNSMYQTILGSTDHQLVFGPSLQYDNIDEKVNENDLGRREIVPGAMIEYTWSRPDLDMEIPDWVIVLGARGDYNSRFDEVLFTPRISVKYNFSTESVFRASAGRGYRSPHVVAENISLLASNRNLVFDPNIGLEEAWNYGVNYSYNFHLAHRKAGFSIDVFRTDFARQIVVDVDQSPQTIYFYHSPGRGWANSALFLFQVNPLEGVDIKLVYKLQDAQATYADGQTRLLPLTARQRGLVTVDYTTPDKKWMFNVRTQIVGPQRLPDNSQIPHELTHGFPANSPTYTIWNAQITYRINKRFELYAGGENLTRYQQHAAIIGADDPSSPFFNGSQIWAPMGGMINYLGLRFSPAGL